jgi:hypothetical protein
LLSAISLAAAGMGTPAMEPPAAGAGRKRPQRPGQRLPQQPVRRQEPQRPPALPSVSIRAITWSDTTVPPSATTSSVSTPAEGAGTSSTTLSVSISIRISSMAIASPTFFFHCSMVASATDSDSWGTLTSTIAMLFLSCAF